jgi:hypothetical protein
MRRRTRPAGRDQVIDAAIRDGKLAAGQRDEYQRLYDGNPSAIHNLLTARVEEGGLMPGLVGSGALLDEHAYDESFLTPGERQMLASRRTAAPATPPAAPAPAPAPAQAVGASINPNDDDYPTGHLTSAERTRIQAAKDGTLVHGPVEFEDDGARRAAGA